MKKIAYIELDTHAEIALNFMELMNESKEFYVDYYFSEKILKTLGLQETENIKKSTPENLIQQLSTDNYQLILIGTVHRYFNVFEKIVEQFNTSIICHNLNFVKASKLDLLRSIFKEDIQYRLKLLLKEGLLRKSNVYKKAKNLLVLDKSLTKENCKNLPIFYTKFFEKPESETFTIVIPGAVSQKRRDYLSVITKLKELKIEKFEIVFLGKAKGKELEMLQIFEQNKPQNISIQYFKEKISQIDFDELMMKADILWCPIQQETEFFSQKEIYGVTKISGNIGDAIKYGKLSIFPKNYPSNYSFIIPEKGGLEDILFVKKEINFSEFSKENRVKQLEDTLNGLL